MTERRDMLVEIGSEELPPKALKQLAQAFLTGMKKGLTKAELEFTGARYFAAPRRLAVQVDQLDLAQGEKHIERRGPALTASFDDNGLPTSAALGFARSCGVDVEQLENLETDKGAWLVYRKLQNGLKTSDLIADIVSKALSELPIPKRMRWGDSNVEFVRPVHWVVLMLGDEAIETDVLGVRAGRYTHGHRFHHPDAMYLVEPAAYAPLLQTEGHVLPDLDARKDAIFAQVTEAAVAVGGEALIDDSLLDEVTALVEWPVTLRGEFPQHFLKVPDAVLISSMQGHQRYFPVMNKAGKLMPYFITVANIDSKDPAAVSAGNERVILPRLEDAMFFYQRDLTIPLIQHCEQLKKVVFQKQLGTLYEKTARVKTLAHYIAQEMQLDSDIQTQVSRAAELSKCDLLTDMVGEFPELQGTMGRVYAKAQGEHEFIAIALEEHYMPRHAGDTLPANPVGVVLAIADKLDTVCGIISIGLHPSGDKDPFALRRAALGVLRILIESQLSLNLRTLLEQACEPFKDVKVARKEKKNIKQGDTVSVIFSFMMERLRAYYHEKGIRPDVFDAVLARQPAQPVDFDQRIRGVTHFRTLPEAQSLASAHKRIHNILRQAEDKIPDIYSTELLIEDAECVLADRLSVLIKEVRPLLQQRQYDQALTLLASLRESIDPFFDQVMVMTEVTKLRVNRLALLKTMGDLFLQTADLSRLQGLSE